MNHTIARPALSKHMYAYNPTQLWEINPLEEFRTEHEAAEVQKNTEGSSKTLRTEMPQVPTLKEIAEIADISERLL